MCDARFSYLYRFVAYHRHQRLARGRRQHDAGSQATLATHRRPHHATHEPWPCAARPGNSPALPTELPVLPSPAGGPMDLQRPAVLGVDTTRSCLLAQSLARLATPFLMDGWTKSLSLVEQSKAVSFLLRTVPPRYAAAALTRPDHIIHLRTVLFRVNSVASACFIR